MNLTNGSIGPAVNLSMVILEKDYEVSIIQPWMPVISLPILMLTSLSIFGCLIVVLSTVQVARERHKDLGETLNFSEEDEKTIYAPKASTSSHSEYLQIDPCHPHIDPKVNQPRTFCATLELFPSSSGTFYLKSPPSTGNVPKQGNHSNRENTNTNRASPKDSPFCQQQADNHRQQTQPESEAEGLSSPSRCIRPNPDAKVAARESSSAPMIMNGLWKRIERVLKMGFDADAKTCQLSFVHHNNNSMLRPSCSDSASLPTKGPKTFPTDRPASLIDNSTVQLESSPSQAETNSSTFPRKIVCRCCIDRQTGMTRTDPFPKSSSSSLLKNLYLKNNIKSNMRVLKLSNKSSDSTSEISSPGRPKLAIHEDDISNKLCLSVDEKIRRYRLCYPSSSDDDSDV